MAYFDKHCAFVPTHRITHMFKFVEYEDLSSACETHATEHARHFQPAQLFKEEL